MGGNRTRRQFSFLARSPTRNPCFVDPSDDPLCTPTPTPVLRECDLRNEDLASNTELVPLGIEEMKNDFRDEMVLRGGENRVDHPRSGGVGVNIALRNTVQ